MLSAALIHSKGGEVEQRRAADLFERHHRALFRYLYHQTRRRDIAEDIVQDVFVRVVRSPTYRESGREAAWLFTIARRLLMDRQRARSRHPMESLPTRATYAEGVQE